MKLVARTQRIAVAFREIAILGSPIQLEQISRLSLYARRLAKCAIASVVSRKFVTKEVPP